MKEQVRKELLAKEGVTAVWEGIKRTGGLPTGRKAVVVAVKKKLPKAQLSPQALVPETTVDGEITDVVEANFKPLSLEDRKKKMIPAVGGISGGSWRLRGSGTLGCLVKYQGQLCFLSNAHAFADLAVPPGETKFQIPDFILQPGFGDGGGINDKVGELVAIVVPQIDSGTRNLVDCAIARSTRKASHEIYELGAYVSLAEVRLDTVVQKSSRTTGVTQGTVIGINGTVAIDYGMGGLSYMDDQIIVRGVSMPGDSGSAVLMMNKELVGLLFAGDTAQGYYVANRIQNVMAALGCEPSYPQAPEPPPTQPMSWWERFWRWVFGFWSR